jgi:hypothetical protein
MTTPTGLPWLQQQLSESVMKEASRVFEMLSTVLCSGVT